MIADTKEPSDRSKRRQLIYTVLSSFLEHASSVALLEVADIQCEIIIVHFAEHG